MDLTTIWYTSVAGIVAAAILIINILKRALVNVPAINKIPTWFMVVIVAFVLTYLANMVWHTLPGDNWLQLVMQSVLTAAVASGFWEWMGEATTTLRQTAIRSGIAPAKE